jgi:cell wall assembly regulator SMI1
LKHLAPEIYWHLRSGALESLIEQTEAKMQMLFPDEVKALYRLHNSGKEMHHGIPQS